MRHGLMAIAALAIAMVSSEAEAQQPSYAEDRALIENMSNHYMVAVDAGDIETVMDTWAEDGVLDGVGGVGASFLLQAAIKPCRPDGRSGSGHGPGPHALVVNHCPGSTRA